MRSLDPFRMGFPHAMETTGDRDLFFEKPRTWTQLQKSVPPSLLEEDVPEDPTKFLQTLGVLRLFLGFFAVCMV